MATRGLHALDGSRGLPSVEAGGSGAALPASRSKPSSTLPPLRVKQMTSHEADGLIKKIIAVEGHQDLKPNPISGSIGSTEDVIADISYLGRTLAAFGPDSPVYQAIGITTGENAFMGFYAAYRAFKRQESASRIGDFGGKLEGGLDAARGINQSIGGVFYLGYRGTMIASEIYNVNATVSATTALGQTTFWIGVVGNVFFGLFYAFLGLACGYQLYRAGRMFSQLKGVQERSDVSGVAQFLLAKAHADAHGQLNKIRGLPPEMQGRYKEELKEQCLDAYAYQLVRWQEKLKKEGKLEGAELSHQAFRWVVEKMFGELEKSPQAKADYERIYREKLGVDQEELEGLDLSPIHLCGLKVDVDHKQMRREARLQRVFGGKVVKQIQDAHRTGLHVRLNSDSAAVRRAAQVEAASLEESAFSALMKTMALYAVLVFVGILGLALSIALIGFFALPPGWMMAMTVLTIVLVLAMGGADAYCWKSGLESGPPAKYDKVFVSAIAAVLIGSLVLAACLTFLGFGFPLLPFIAAAIMGAAGLAICAYTLVTLRRHEKKWKEEHPDLKRFSDEINQLPRDERLDEKALALFKLLPKTDRQEVRKHYLARTLASDASQAYINSVMRAEDLEAVVNEYRVLERAAKKTSKEFWAKWEHVRQEEDMRNAEKMSELFEVLKAQRQEIENTGVLLRSRRLGGHQNVHQQIEEVKRDYEELYRAFKQNVHYLSTRENKAGELSAAAAAAARAVPAPTPELNAEDLKRAKQVFIQILEEKAHS